MRPSRKQNKYSNEAARTGAAGNRTGGTIKNAGEASAESATSSGASSATRPGGGNRGGEGRNPQAKRSGSLAAASVDWTVLDGNVLP